MSAGSVLGSPWVPCPEHVAAGGELPAGFRWSGLAGGLKPGGALDLGLVVSERAGTVSAARFCDSGVLAAPVVLTRERCNLAALRAVIVNSGNANAATGEAGLAQAARVQEAAAAALGLHPREVAVASTGVIGVLLPGELIASRAGDLAAALDHDADDFALAIRTTDSLEKRVELTVTLGAGAVRLAAQCKGAGMISPRFATMLCFVQTDASMAAESVDALLGSAVRRSFDRISVDGQLSTNDTVIMLANGASEVRIEPDSDDERDFGDALDALLRTLALRIVADGEGARRVGRVVVRGGGQDAVERVARAVADSPLVKTALYGADPNWGRVAQAVGAALPGSAPLDFAITMGGVAVARNGAAIPFELEALAAAVAAETVLYEIDLPGEGAEAELFFSDLGYEYVRINAEYTT